MEISGILKAALLNVRAKDHESVLKELTARLLPDMGMPEKDKAFCDLRSHESTEGALSGSGCAMFHCLSEEVESPVAAFAVSRKGIPRPGHKNPVRIFFLIISPIRESGTHLQLLARLEALLLDRRLQRSLFEARSLEEAKGALKKAAAASKSLYLPLEKDEVLSELSTAENGLTGEEAAKRLATAGPNRLKRFRKKSLLRDFLQNMFLNLLAVLLWAGGAMAFIAGMPELGWAIFLVIAINAAFSFWQEFKAERAVEALLKLLPSRVTVIRDGAEKEIDSSRLVPGDLIRLSEGDSVPADGRLVEAEAMRIDNSALTGESKPVYKTSEPIDNHTGFVWTELPNMVFAGTTVLSGAGTLVVTATGMDTEIGRVAYLTQTIEPEKSPLQREIEALTKTVTVIAVSLGAAFFFLGYWIAGLTFAESFIFAIGIIVANVPEGLLPTVSLSLAMGVQRMAGKRAIVKKLSAVETLGSATVICTDKTGTLTSNEMRVTEIFANGERFELTGAGYDPSGYITSAGRRLSEVEIEQKGLKTLLETFALCNNAGLRQPAGGQTQWTISGDPTEAALLTAAVKAGIEPEKLKARHRRIAHLPFERIRKRMSTVHENGFEEGASRAALVKGAPREMLSISDRVLLGGEVVPLTDEMRSRILLENDRMADKGLRVLGAAFKSIGEKDGYSASDTETGLTFIGLAAMMDPPRPEVRKAVEECRSAGIKIIMVTGDYGLTARAVAAQIGMAADGSIISGEDLARITDRELQEIVRKEAIFARVAPADKLRVVSALQENGEVVAVTGDGVNDAPALKKADIGIAMGMRGSDVAKESAEIVLTDDNFASIVDAIREGRAVYSNIKKFVTYIFASNIPELVPFIAFVLFKIPLPLTIMQILAIDLGTDVLPALGLGVEPPEEGIMKEPPRPREKRLLDFNTLSRAYLFLGPIEAALALSGFFFLYWMRGWHPGEAMPASGPVYFAATTMSFAGIVAAQMGNVFACRTARSSVFSAGLFTNRLILFGLAAEFCLVLLLVYTPLSKVFGTSALKPLEWGYLLFFPFAMLLADEARKAFVRARLKRP